MTDEKKSAKKESDLDKLTKELDSKIHELEKIRKSKILLLHIPGSITRNTVTDVYNKLRKEYKGQKVVDVIVNSSGGDIDAAYHLAQIIRRFAPERLGFIVPRYAKSAATLLVCGGDSIVMGPTSELGPLDPQITDVVRGEQISPLSIRSTIDLISGEIENGKEEMAKLLADKLLPLTMGEYLKTLEIAMKYQQKLLETRMFKNDTDSETQKKIIRIAEKFVKGYPHHGYCIDIDEAKELGLKIYEPSQKEWDTIWEAYEMIERIEDEMKKLKMEKIRKMIGKDNISKELLEHLRSCPILDEVCG